MLSEPLEYLLTSTECTDPWSTSILNPLTTTTVWSYKGTELNGMAASCAVPLNKDFLLFLSAGKPVLNLVGLQSRERIHQRSILPGVAACLVVANDSTVCCVAIDEHIYTWMISTGQLVTIVTGHYQPISKLAFTDDSWLLVSAGKDGVLQVWNVGDLVTPHDPGVSKPNPLRRWDAHGVEITGLYVSRGGLRSRICTCSADQTLKIHDIAGDQCILTVVFDCGLGACCMDQAETRVFVGTNKGLICLINLYKEPVARTQHVSTIGSEAEYPFFRGHTQRVTALDSNFDGSLLASGDSESIKIWHIPSRQNLKTIPTKDYKADLVTQPFKKQLCTHLAPTVHVSVGRNSQKRQLTVDEIMKNILSDLEKETNKETEESNSKDQDSPQEASSSSIKQKVEEETTNLLTNCDTPELEGLKQELAATKGINRDLYRFVVNRILGGTAKKKKRKSEDV